MLTTGKLEGASWTEGAACGRALGKAEGMLSGGDSEKASKLGVDETALKWPWKCAALPARD